jgi:ribonuclease Z
VSARLLPRLVNGRDGDPGLYIEAMHASGAVLVDCGDLSPLSPRHLLRVRALLISHTHMDHWAGFDRLLRLLIGREHELLLAGPPGFAEQLWHRLRSYTWNLVDRIPAPLVLEAVEVLPPGEPWPRARFRLQTGFAPEPLPPLSGDDGVLGRLGTLTLRAAVLDHGTPSLGFAVEEAQRLNVWRTRLAAQGLAPGPWLTALKAAIMEGQGDEHPIRLPDGTSAPLGALRGLVTATAGQRIVWLTDLADTPENRATAIALARGADTLFIEAPFAASDTAIAAERQHLTTSAAGEIARAAGVRRVEPFHLSPRYQDREAELLAEVAQAFGGPVGGGALPLDEDG